MLVLSRKTNDTIIIGDNIKIQVLKVKGNTIRLGVQAPDDVKILRGELSPYDIESDRETRQQETPSEQFANDPAVIEYDLNTEDLATLPNPFVVAHAG